MLLTHLNGAGDLQIKMQRTSTMFCHKNQKEINHHLKCELARNQTSKTSTSKSLELHVHVHLWGEQNTKEDSSRKEGVFWECNGQRVWSLQMQWTRSSMYLARKFVSTRGHTLGSLEVNNVCAFLTLRNHLVIKQVFCFGV